MCGSGECGAYAPHHPTQLMWKVKELEWPDVGFPAAFILHKQQEQAAKLLPWKVGGRGGTQNAMTNK